MGKGTAGKDADMYVTGTSTSMTDEACTENSGTEFQITNSAKRILDTSVAIVVKVDSVVQSSGFTVDKLFGVITFDVSQAGSTVTITGNYLPRHNVAKIQNWSLSDSKRTADTTCLQDDAADTTPLERTASISFTTFSLLEDVLDAGSLTLQSIFDADNPVVFELQPRGSSEKVIRVRSLLNEQSWSAATGDVISVDLGAVGSGDGNSLISKRAV